MANYLELGEVIAYRERESTDPGTGRIGILRTEWRVSRVLDWPVDELIRAWEDEEVQLGRISHGR